MGKNKTLDRGTVDKLKRAFAYKLFFQQGVLPFDASLNDYYLAVSSFLRDRKQGLFINSVAALRESKGRIVCYLSAEFLMGPHLLNNLINLGLHDELGFFQFKRTVQIESA
jgi:glycogen phosphorylase